MQSSLASRKPAVATCQDTLLKHAVWRLLCCVMSLSSSTLAQSVLFLQLFWMLRDTHAIKYLYICSCSLQMGLSTFWSWGHTSYPCTVAPANSRSQHTPSSMDDAFEADESLSGLADDTNASIAPPPPPHPKAATRKAKAKRPRVNKRRIKSPGASRTKACSVQYAKEPKVAPRIHTVPHARQMSMLLSKTVKSRDGVRSSLNVKKARLCSAR